MGITFRSGATLATPHGGAWLPIAHVASHADVVILAVPWAAALDVVREAGSLDGKILVDCTNPIADGMESLSVGPGTSAAELIAAAATGARVVKAFNTIGAARLDRPLFGEQAATMCVAGDDAAAKSVAMELASELGFDALDAGPLSSARLLEHLALLWIRLAVGQQLGPHVGFKLLSD